MVRLMDESVDLGICQHNMQLFKTVSAVWDVQSRNVDVRLATCLSFSSCLYSFPIHLPFCFYSLFLTTNRALRVSSTRKFFVVLVRYKTFTCCKYFNRNFAYQSGNNENNYWRRKQFRGLEWKNYEMIYIKKETKNVSWRILILNLIKYRPNRCRLFYKKVLENKKKLIVLS